MSRKISSTDFKSKAIIDSIPKSLKVKENSIVKYIWSQPPASDLDLVQVIKKFDTVGPYKTGILEKAFLFNPITEQPLSKSGLRERKTQISPQKRPLHRIWIS